MTINTLEKSTSLIDLYSKIAEEAMKTPDDRWRPSGVVKNKSGLFREYLNEVNLESFRRTPLCLGEQNWPDKPGNVHKTWHEGLPFWNKLKGLSFMRKRLNLYRKYLRESGVTFKPSEFEDNMMGNPCYYFFPGIGRVTEASLRYGFYLSRIRYMVENYAKDNKVESILEIGGGFGYLPGLLMKYSNVKRCFLSDLPEDLFLTYYNLSQRFEETHLIYRKEDLDLIKEKGIYVVAPWVLPDLKVDVDLTVNTMSFQHMNKTNLDYYFDVIDRLKSKFIYFVNRGFSKRLPELGVDDYPIPGRYEQLYYERFFIWNHLECFYKRSS